MKRLRRGLVAVGLAAAGVVGTTSFAGGASAATGGAAPYNGACGAGYQVIDFADLKSAAAAEATTYLTWNQATGKNCVVTVRTTPGSTVRVVAEVFQTRHTSVHAIDDGLYTRYAGPVYISARGQCVTWRGALNNLTVEHSGHCG